MLNLFNRIAAVGSPSEKIKLLRQYPFQQELKTVLRLATDPFTTFGITNFEDSGSIAELNHYEVLGDLARRKLTGGEAKAQLGRAVAHMDDDDKEVVRRILRKDLRCGLGEKLVLAAYPGLIRQFEVMKAKKFEKLKTRTSYVIEPKYDGLRCLGFIERGVAKLFSRNGLEFTSSDHLKPELLKLANGRDLIFDGELTSGDFNSSVSAVKKKHVPNSNTVMTIFDVLTMDEWKTPVTIYRDRRKMLVQLFLQANLDKLVMAPSYSVQNLEEIYQYYGHFLDAGLEGGMVKDINGLYRFSRHADWQKLKEINDVDLVCEGLVQGEGKYYGMLGALVFKYKGKRISVGSGISDEERTTWWKDPSLVKGKVCEIHYHQITPDGSLRHPRLYCIREDKS